MTNKEKEQFLIELEDAKADAFSEGIPYVPKVKKLVSKLNQIDDTDKPFFKKFAKDLSQELFESSIDVVGLNLIDFESTHSSKEEKNITKRQLDYNAAQTLFLELFKNTVNTLKIHLMSLKGYYIFKLENDPTLKYQLVILHDNLFYINPIKRSIKKENESARIYVLDGFHSFLSSDSQEQNNYLCVLFLKSKDNDMEELEQTKKVLGKIINYFKNFEYYSLNNLENTKGEFYKSDNKKGNFLDELKYVSGKLLSNNKIDHEEEKIIKKLFHLSNTPLLIYKVLKPGYSGSKVVEVRPKQEFGSEKEKRYVVKFAKKEGEKRKIKDEAERFQTCIGDYKGGFEGYSQNYGETMIYEGIKNEYAVSSSEMESYPLANAISINENPFHKHLQPKIRELFEIELFNLWLDSKENSTIKTSSLYNDYLNPKESFDAICKIKNCSSDDLKKSTMYKDFEYIWSSEINVCQKICHGDLHTENIFLDDNKMYLIDFGFTGERHAVIDHSTLECSLKFRHFPFYLNTEELDIIEDELLTDKSFQLSYSFKSTKRENVLSLLDMIKLIRNDALKYVVDQNSSLEYYLSVYIITLRQVKYKNLNQLYAYRSLLKLGSKVKELIDLQ